MQTLLPTMTESSKLYYRNAEGNDIMRLQAICESWTDKLLVEGEEFAPDYIANCIENGDLPPIENARIENYSFKAICRRTDNQIIGFFEMYQGYPASDVLWISMFVIDQTVQKSGYGSEIIQSLSCMAKQCGFSALGVGVYLKNLKGLNFWVKNGFYKVAGTSDKVDTNSIIKLKKIL